MLIWLKNQGKVRYRTFQLRQQQVDAGPEAAAESWDPAAAAAEPEEPPEPEEPEEPPEPEEPEGQLGCLVGRNEGSIAKFGVDTAKNERSKVWRNNPGPLLWVK